MLNSEAIKKFRRAVYFNVTARRDATMNLLDALSSYGECCKHVVELSEAPCFERQYSSITDAIADGLSTVDWSSMSELIYKQVESTKRVVLIPDCTSHVRPFSPSLADRHVTHCPNPAPGNKPIGVGHQYSVVGVQPPCRESADLHWLLPLLVDRVESNQKGHEVGMQQISDAIEQFGLSQKLAISIGDSLYSTEYCRAQVRGHDNWVHICRLNSKRNMYTRADNKTSARYGEKMQLNHAKSHVAHQGCVHFSRLTPNGKHLQISVTAWKEMLCRGSRSFKGNDFPMTLYRVIATDETGKPHYKRPLWLLVSGKRRDDLSAEEVYDYYVDRYDIEYYFRFGKERLLMSQYQTPCVDHEEYWWKFCALAYVQLYLARKMVPLLPRPWERYLPSYKKKHEQNKQYMTTPSQTQRGFSHVLQSIGTPAKACRKRGRPVGRKKGDRQDKRQRYAINLKGKKTKKAKNTVLLVSDQSTKNSDPQNVEQLVKNVVLQLGKLDCTAETFANLLKNAS